MSIKVNGLLCVFSLLTYVFSSSCCSCSCGHSGADRVVFFSTNAGGEASSGGVNLLDGDKILCLVASHLKQHLSNLSKSLEPEPTFGIIQTAYANGSSTRFLESELGK